MKPVKMNIPKFKLEFPSWEREAYMELVEKILISSKPISNGDFVQKFEQEFKKMNGSKYAVAVGSGTDALEVALRTIFVKGKYVLFPTNTMIGTVFAIMRAGGIPYPVDIEKKGFGINYYELQKILGNIIAEESLAGVGAVILVHIGGSISPYVPFIKSLCKDYEIPIIEDAAQSHFAIMRSDTRDENIAGNIGDIGCFSFSATKVMTTGEGGMCTTNREDYDEKMRMIRNFGSPKGKSHIHTIEGGNFKMTEFQGALGILELMRVFDRIKRRTNISDMYRILLDKEKYNVVNMGEGSHYKQIVLIEEVRDDLYKWCMDNGVSMTGEVYPIPIHRQPCFKDWFQVPYPVSDIFCQSHICPPNYPELEDEEVRYVCDVLNSF